MKSLNQKWQLSVFLTILDRSVIFQCLFLRLEVYPKPWRMAFLEAEAQITETLHAFNPVTQKTLSLWYDHYQ